MSALFIDGYGGQVVIDFWAELLLCQSSTERSPRRQVQQLPHCLQRTLSTGAHVKSQQAAAPHLASDEETIVKRVQLL